MTPRGRLPAFKRSAVVFLAAYVFAFLAAGKSAVRLPISEFMARAGAIGPQEAVELQGTVTAIWGDDAFFMQDGDAGVFVLRENVSAELRPNENVTVTGCYVPVGVAPAINAEFIRHNATSARGVTIAGVIELTLYDTTEFQ